MKDPFHIQWHITNVCNLRCRHCYQDDFSKGGDLDWKGLREISDNISSTMERWDKEATVHVTGGEPLLKPEVFQLLGYLDKNRLIGELGLITNGLCFHPGVIEKLSACSKLKKIKISLDGADGEINDSIRQKGVFEKVVRTLSYFKEDDRFETTLMFTLMKRNFKDLISYVRLCEDLGVNGVILERFVPWGQGRKIRDDVLDRDEWKEVLEALLGFFSLGKAEDLCSFQAFQINFHLGEMELSGAPCIVGRDGICIMPEGDVYPCRRFPRSIGNLLREPLSEIWSTSEILASVRVKKNLRGRCGTCRMKDCRGCRSLALALTGNYLEEDPYCPYPPNE